MEDFYLKLNNDLGQTLIIQYNRNELLPDEPLDEPLPDEPPSLSVNLFDESIQQNFISNWHYVSILFDTTTTIRVLSKSIPAGIDFTNKDNLKLHLDFSLARFKEVKLYPYFRYNIPPSLFPYFSTTQIDTTKEKLSFYFPLADPQFYLYDAYGSAQLPSGNFYWTSDATNTICPPGYILNTMPNNPGSTLTNYETAPCIKQAILKGSLQTTLNINAGFIGISFWLYLKFKHNTDRNFIELNASPIVLITKALRNSKTAIQILDTGSSNIEHEMPIEEWVYIGCGFIGKQRALYVFDHIVSKTDDGNAEILIGTNNFKLTLGNGIYVKDLHIVSSNDNTFPQSFSGFRTKRVYPYESIEHFKVIAYLPGYTISTNKKLVIFLENAVIENALHEPTEKVDIEVPLEQGNTFILTIELHNTHLASKYNRQGSHHIPLADSEISETPLTFEWWVQFVRIKDTGTFIFKIESSNTLLSIDMSTSSYTFQGTKVKELPMKQRWIHIAITLDIRMQLYLNRKLSKEVAQNPLSSFNPEFTINGLTVLLKQFRTWSKVLTHEEIIAYSITRVRMWQPYLVSIYTFEPYATYTNFFPVYHKTGKVTTVKIRSVANAGDNPLFCAKEGEYFSGTECKSTNFVHMEKEVTSGMIVPMKNRARKGFEWTLEGWVYVFSGDTKMAIFSLEGDRVKLLARLNGNDLIAQLLYITVSTTNTFNGFKRGTWNHIAIVTRLSFPFYDLELLVNGVEFSSSRVIIKVTTGTFDYLYLGMDKENEHRGKIRMKELRVWNTALQIQSIKEHMRTQIKHSTHERRLIYYFPFDKLSIEEYEDKGYEGDLHTNYLRDFLKEYPASVKPPQILSAEDIVPLIICDEYYNEDTMMCEKDMDEVRFGLEQAHAPFIIPLSEYVFTVGWTFEFWIRIDQMSGLGNMIFSQTCHPRKPSTLNFYKDYLHNRLIFSFINKQNGISFPEEHNKWIHYAFVNEPNEYSLLSYKQGLYYGSVESKPIAIPSCDLMIGQHSTKNELRGIIRELKIWDNIRTQQEIIRGMHYAVLDNSLALYLPLAEGYGTNINEVVIGSTLSLNLQVHSREIWATKGNLKICKAPFIYNSEDNMCICTLTN